MLVPNVQLNADSRSVAAGRERDVQRIVELTGDVEINWGKGHKLGPVRIEYNCTILLRGVTSR